MIKHGIEYQRPTSLNMRILADHVTYSFLAFMKSIFHFCLGCYCGGYSQNRRSNLSSLSTDCSRHSDLHLNMDATPLALHLKLTSTGYRNISRYITGSKWSLATPPWTHPYQWTVASQAEVVISGIAFTIPHNPNSFCNKPSISANSRC